MPLLMSHLALDVRLKEALRASRHCIVVIRYIVILVSYRAKSQHQDQAKKKQCGRGGVDESGCRDEVESATQKSTEETRYEDAQAGRQALAGLGCLDITFTSLPRPRPVYYTSHIAVTDLTAADKI
jgi:hypothetical protein